MPNKQYYFEIHNNYLYGKEIKGAKSIYLNGVFLGVYIPEQFKGVYGNDRRILTNIVNSIAFSTNNFYGNRKDFL